MKQYTSRQWAMGAAFCAVLVLLAVVALPWYTVGSSPLGGGSQSLDGTERPFLGTWDIVLSAVAAAAAAVYLLMPLTPSGAKGVLGLSATLYGVVWILTFVDISRDMPAASGVGFSYGKAFGMYSASFGAFAGMAMAAYAIVVLNKERPSVAPASLGAVPSAPGLCTYCRAPIPPGALKCPSCGAAPARV